MRQAFAPVTLETGWSWRFAWWTRFITALTARGVSKSSARALTTLDLASANLDGEEEEEEIPSWLNDTAESRRGGGCGRTSPRERLPGLSRSGADPSCKPERRAWSWRWTPENSGPPTCCHGCSRWLEKNNKKKQKKTATLKICQKKTKNTASVLRLMFSIFHLICICSKGKTSGTHWQSRISGSPDGAK